MASFAMVAISYVLALVHAFSPGGEGPEAPPVPVVATPTASISGASAASAAAGSLAAVDATAKDAVSDAVGPDEAGPKGVADAGVAVEPAGGGGMTGTTGTTGASTTGPTATGPTGDPPGMAGMAGMAGTASARADQLFRDADLAHGAALLAEHDCNACHQRNVGGDGLRIYRPAGRINTPSRLVTMVEFCNTQLGLQLFPEDVTAISAVLNRDHYRFD
jgi:hypothetical protein